MFKAIGKWFDSLWESKKVETTKENKEPSFDLYNLYHGIDYHTDSNPDRVVILEIDSLHGNGEVATTNSYGFRYKGKHDVICFSPDHLAKEFEDFNNQWFQKEFSRFINDLGERYTAIRFKVYTLGVDIPVISLKEANKLIKATKPGTANLWTHNVYLKEVLPGGWFKITDATNGLNAKIKDWVFDVSRYLSNTTENSTDCPKFIITDYDTAPREVIPHQDIRRWVEIKELTSASDPWVLRYAPLDIARGKVRYFSLDFIFDAIDLEHVAFDPLLMIDWYVTRLQLKLDKELIGESTAIERWDGRDNTESRIDINTNNLRVVHKELNTSLVDYLRRQKDHPEFRDARPYLNPQSHHITINRQVLGFNEKGEFFTRYDHERTGDANPPGKTPYY